MWPRFISSLVSKFVNTFGRWGGLGSITCLKWYQFCSLPFLLLRKSSNCGFLRDHASFLVYLVWTIAPARVQSLPGRLAVVQRRLVWASARWNGTFLLVSSCSQVDLIVAKHKAILKFILNGRWNLLGLHTKLLLQIRWFQDEIKYSLSLVPRLSLPRKWVWYFSSDFLYLLTQQSWILTRQSESPHVTFHVTWKQVSLQSKTAS